ncbi:hypothetical protein [Roseibium sp. RKSG952]|uniref:hypothetical protein n=1 Tax=Roseibium sp. RKSG952 TaxID=2529384 RepID=UPI0012BD38BD|nr:hypothetical protein [Roseibium sp. RKSG952]MTH95981.1 hypothetical protein [Roseibium sp. RKSG952]
MKPADGYRLNIRRIQDFTRVTQGFRTDAMRLLARRYGREVAAQAVLMYDLSRIGIGEDHGSEVIRKACEVVKRKYPDGRGGVPHADLNCIVNYFLLDDAVLAIFRHGAGAYRKAFEARREVARWAWSADGKRPQGISRKSWQERELTWKEALKQPGLAPGLSFRLIETTLPSIGWANIRRYIPSAEDRVKAILFAGNGYEAELRAAMMNVVTRKLTKETLLGTEPPDSVTTRRQSPVKPVPKKTAAAKKEPLGDPEKAAQIDHADVIKSSDGRIFLAVPYVGLSEEDRIYIKITDGVLSVDQNAVSFGTVSRIPRVALDLVSGAKTVTIVEVARSGGKRLLRAKHVAMVRDMRIAGQALEVLGAYKTNGIETREIEEWEAR